MRKCREEFGKNYDSQIHFSEFNSVIVDPDHRGLGFQRLMLSMCYQFAAKDGSEYLKNNEPVFIGAEGSPINSYSHNNFTNMGYEVVSTIVFEDHSSPFG